MATETSSIDDLLLSGHTTTQPAAPENQYDDEPETTTEPDETYEDEPAKPFQADNAGDDYAGSNDEPEEKPVDADKSEDEYGNKKQQDNEVIRERLARQAESMKRQHQAEIDALRAQMQQQPPAVQRAAEGFEYNPDDGQTWDQQLRGYIEQTVTSMTVRQQQAAQQAREVRAQQEFEGKFHQGMSNFPDFIDVVGSTPVTDHMVLATRGMKDPAAFIYAASKRMPQELQRIAQIQDPYAQMAEIGRLEASLRQQKPGTKAPKPIARQQEDGHIQHKNDKEPTIEDLIAHSDRQKMIRMSARNKR